LITKQRPDLSLRLGTFTHEAYIEPPPTLIE
jgi:hypothetical protein